MDVSYMRIEDLDKINNLGQFNDMTAGLMYSESKERVEEFLSKRIESLGEKGMYPYYLNVEYCREKRYFNPRWCILKMEDGDMVGLFLKSTTAFGSSRDSTNKLVKMAIEPISLNDNEENVKKVINKLISVGYIVKIQLIEEELDKYKKYLSKCKKYDEDFFIRIESKLKKLSSSNWRTKNYIKFFECDGFYVDYDYCNYKRISELYSVWAKNLGLKESAVWIRKVCEDIIDLNTTFKFVSILYKDKLLACHVIDPVCSGKYFHHIANFSMGMLSEEEIREYMGDSLYDYPDFIKYLRRINKKGLFEMVKYIHGVGGERLYLAGYEGGVQAIDRLREYKTSITDDSIKYYMGVFKDGVDVI